MVRVAIGTFFRGCKEKESFEGFQAEGKRVFCLDMEGALRHCCV